MGETEILPDLPEEQSNEPEKSQRRSVVAIVLGCLLIAFCLLVFAGMTALSWDAEKFLAKIDAIDTHIIKRPVQFLFKFRGVVAPDHHVNIERKRY